MTAYALWDPTSLFAGDFPIAKRSITLAQSAGAQPRGAVLGRVAATDKYIPCVKTASDGSQIPAAILAADTDATAGDISTDGYFTGEYAGEKLTVDASWTITTLEAALRQAATMLFVRSVGQLG